LIIGFPSDFTQSLNTTLEML